MAARACTLKELTGTGTSATLRSGSARSSTGRHRVDVGSGRAPLASTSMVQTPRHVTALSRFVGGGIGDDPLVIPSEIT